MNRFIRDAGFALFRPKHSATLQLSMVVYRS